MACAQPMPAPSGSVTLSIDGPLATLTLANPGKLNGVSLAMWQQLRAHCEALSEDTELRCVIVRGADGNFAAGGDIAEFPLVRATRHDLYAYHVQNVAPALRALAECLHPTVALIEGVCMGGGLEIATQCDLRIAAENCRFGAPINRLGFPMAPDELHGLLALVGPSAVSEILLEGRILDAREALAKGLLTRVVADDAVAAEALASAQRIAAGAPLAARINKQTIRRLTPQAQPLSDAEVRAHLARWADSHDHREGVAAFLEKRKPRFIGA